MKPLKKEDLFPFSPYADQGKTIFDVMLKAPRYVARLVQNGDLVLTAEARESLETWCQQPLGARTQSRSIPSGQVEVSGRIIHRTFKAVLFENEMHQGWIAKQFFTESGPSDEKDHVVAYIPEWLAVKEGFV